MNARVRAGAGENRAEERPVLHLIVVDADAAVRRACLEIGRKMGFAVVGAESTEAARALLEQRSMDVVLLDVQGSGEALGGGGSGGEGLGLLEELKGSHPETSVIVMTAFATVASAVRAMRVGASDFLTKPFAMEELVGVLERARERRQVDLESRRLRERLRTQTAAGGLIGQSAEMEKLYRMVSKVAYSMHPVLILGESGSGKELVARTIHFNGPQEQRPFVPVDCESLVPELMEGELFGYAKGAVLGAGLGVHRAGTARAKEGLLAAAAGGTVFLDEVGELAPELQGRLLRALEERAVTPVGAAHAVPISVRVLAGSSRNLGLLVEQGRFRKDLFLRLNVVSLRIPSLRSRKEDIPALVQHFLERIERETGRRHSFSDDALRSLMEYEWPGNVRELESAIERSCALSSGPLLHVGDMPTQLQSFRVRVRAEEAVVKVGAARPEEGTEEEIVSDRIISIADLERQTILRTMRQLKGDKLMAAKLLGIGKTTLYRKLKEYGILDEVQVV